MNFVLKLTTISGHRMINHNFTTPKLTGKAKVLKHVTDINLPSVWIIPDDILFYNGFKQKTMIIFEAHYGLLYQCNHGN